MRCEYVAWSIVLDGVSLLNFYLSSLLITDFASSCRPTPFKDSSRELKDGMCSGAIRVGRSACSRSRAAVWSA